MNTPRTDLESQLTVISCEDSCIETYVYREGDLYSGDIVTADFARQLERELNALRWIPISERLPTIEDGNEFEDVEWSDGKDIWQGNYKNSRKHNTTHWRRITLP